MLEKFERYPLTFGLTPIEKMRRLSGHLGGQVELFAKREDCNSGLAGGGNILILSSATHFSQRLSCSVWSNSTYDTIGRGRNTTVRPCGLDSIC